MIVLEHGTYTWAAELPRDQAKVFILAIYCMHMFAKAGLFFQGRIYWIQLNKHSFLNHIINSL